MPTARQELFFSSEAKAATPGRIKTEHFGQQARRETGRDELCASLPETEEARLEILGPKALVARRG